MLGGENQRSKLFLIRANSAKAHCTGKPPYLEPISQSMHVPVEGVYCIAEKIEDRSRIGEKHSQNHVEKQRRTYLERIRNRMQKPVEGLLRVFLLRLYKREGGLKPRVTVQSLLYEFAFLPSHVLTSTFTAFRGGCRIRASAVPANLLVQPSFLRYSLLHWVKYRHRGTSCSELTLR